MITKYEPGSPRFCVSPSNLAECWTNDRQNQNIAVHEDLLDEDGPLLMEKISSKIWKILKTMMWAVYDEDLRIILVLRSILGWRTTARWRSRYSW